MPLQRHDTTAVDRPAGLEPPPVPRTGVTELRVHGVGGTTPQSMLGDDAPQLVSGDRIAGFYRTADVRGRHVEAYSWGGLTSNSGTRALWLLLLPFALANLAGWMCASNVHNSRWPFRAHRAAVRWASLALTVNMLLISVLLFVDAIAYQCGGQVACVGDHWWLAPLRHGALALHPGRRVAIGALVPLLLIGLLAALTWRTLSRYEHVRPPYEVPKTDATDDAETTAPEDRHVAGAATTDTALTDPHFWDGERSTRRLGLLHIGVAMAFVAAAVVTAAATATTATGAAPTLPALRLMVLIASAVVVAVVVGWLAVDYDRMVRIAGTQRPLAWTPLLVALGALAGGLVYAWVQPAVPQAASGAQASGWALADMGNAAPLAWGAVLMPVVLVAGTTLLGHHEKATFRWGPFVAVGMAVVILNLFGLAVLLSVSTFVAPVRFVPAAGNEVQALYLSRTIGTALPTLVCAVLVVATAFGLWAAVHWWRAGRDEDQRAALVRSYQGERGPRDDEPTWTYSAITDRPWSRARSTRPAPDGTRWLTRTLRARALTDLPRCGDIVLGTIVVASAAAVAFAVATDEGAPWMAGWLLRVGSVVATFLPVLLLTMLRRSLVDVERRRRLGVLWDVGTFWPRAYHPLAPPSYAERAVPDLHRRMWRLHDSGGSVVLAAHSQGAVLAAAALLLCPRDRQCDDTTGWPANARVTLFTFGAPLHSLYRWAFPAYFGAQVLQVLANRSTVGLRRWRNVCYATDVIGGPVGATEDVDGRTVPVDVELLDPVDSWHAYGDPRPAIGAHSGYWTDPRMWDLVDEAACQLAGSCTCSQCDVLSADRGRCHTNPWTAGDVTYDVRGRNGEASAATADIVVRGAFTGLSARNGTTISLARPADSVDIRLVAVTACVTLTAWGDAARPQVSRARARADESEQVLHLTGGDITRIDLASQGEVLILEVAVHVTPRA